MELLGNTKLSGRERSSNRAGNSLLASGCYEPYQKHTAVILPAIDTQALIRLLMTRQEEINQDEVCQMLRKKTLTN